MKRLSFTELSQLPQRKHYYNNTNIQTCFSEDICWLKIATKGLENY